MSNDIAIDKLDFRFLRLSVNDRHTGTTGYSFSTNFGNDFSLDNVKAVSLQHASIPNVGYNISAARGTSTFSYTDTGGAKTATIADGQYSLSALLTALTTAMNTASNPRTVSWTQDAVSRKLNVAISASTIQVLSPANPSLNWVLGWTASSSASANITADSLPNLEGDTMFHINSAAISNNKTSIGANGFQVNCAFSIPIDVAWGATQTYSSIDGQDILYFPNTISLRNIDILIKGSNELPAYQLGLNHNSIIVLKVWY